MQIALDAHVHFYPCYEPLALDRRLLEWRREGSPQCLQSVILAERGQDTAFATAVERGSWMPGWSIAALYAQGRAMRVVQNDGSLAIHTARQLACRERIELFAIGASAPFQDGLPAVEAIERILKRNAIPALPWGLGKWLGARGALVKALIRRYAGQGLALIDSSMRPIGWPTPSAFRLGRDLGCALLAGSDPMPYAGDARAIGSYGSLIDSTEAELDSPDWWRRAEAETTFGRRASFLAVGIRFFRSRRAKRMTA